MYLIFDIDGTVIDHRKRMYACYEAYGKKHGYGVLSFDEYLKAKGEGTSEKDIAAQTFPASWLDSYLSWKRSVIEEDRFLKLDTLYNGMARILNDLAATHTLVALSARQSHKRLKRQLTALGVAYEFSHVLTASEVSLIAKKETLEVFLNEHHLNPHEVIVIGDTEVEWQLAVAVGARHITVSWGVRSEAFLRTLGATRIAANPKALKRLINI